MAEQVAAEKKTIDVRVEQEAQNQAQRLLRAKQEWLTLKKQQQELRRDRAVLIRSWLDWWFERIYKSAGAWGFYLAWSAAVIGIGWFWGINTGETVVCSDRSSLCYKLRIRTKFTKEQVAKPVCNPSKEGLVCSVKVDSAESNTSQ